VNDGVSKYIADSQYKKKPAELSVIILIDSESSDMQDISRVLSSRNLRGVEFVVLNYTDEFQVSDIFDRVCEVLRSADIGIGRRRYMNIYAAYIWLQKTFSITHLKNNILNLTYKKKEFSFSEAINNAIRLSSGKYVFILNNDKLLNNNLSYLFDFINKILAGEHLFSFPFGASEKEMVSYDNIASYVYRLSDLKIDKKYSPMLFDMAFFKKKWMHRLGGFDDSFGTTSYIKNNLNSYANNLNYKTYIFDEVSHRFNFETTTLKCLKKSSNSVYECQINGAYRVIRVICHSRDLAPLVKGEIDWINYLGDNGVPVCRAILSASGNYVEVIEMSNDFFLASAFIKAQGHTIDLNSDSEWNDALFNKWGAIMGRMHYLSKDYSVSDPSTKRPDWNHEFFFDPQFDLGSDNEKILRIWRALVDELNKLQKNKESYGLVHNDFSHNNFMYDGTTIIPIDFDDCKYNWFVGDIAISLYHAVMIVPKYERNKFARRFIRNFFTGYYSENNLENYWIDLLPKFILLRHIYNYLFYQQNWNLTTLTSEQRGIMAFLKSSIESERPIIDINFKEIWNDIAFGGARDANKMHLFSI
jgi:amicoumacin kinase